MRKSSLVKALLSFVFLAIIAVGCNTNDNPVTPTTTAPVAPTGLQATALNDSTIRLKWTASTSTGESDFGGYLLSYQITSGAQNVKLSAVTTTDVTGLKAGTQYTFTLKSRRSNDTLSATSVSVTWSPSYRFADVIKLYETASAFGSGLDIYDATAKTPQLLKIANGTLWDICLDTRNESWDIGSPTASSYVDAQGKFTSGAQTGQLARTTVVYKVIDSVSSLDDIFGSQSLDKLGNPKEALAHFGDLPSIGQNKTKSFVLVVKTADGNFAKVLVKATSGGTILQGTAPNRYVEVQVAYQTGAGVPYAKPAGGGTPMSKKQ